MHEDSPDIQALIMFFRRGEQPPIDLIFRALDAGVDVAALEARYGL